MWSQADKWNISKYSNFWKIISELKKISEFQ